MQLLTRKYCHSQVTTQSTLGSAVLCQKELHSAPFLGHSTLSFSSQALSGQSFHDSLPATCQHASLWLSDRFKGHKHSHKRFPVPPREAVMPCVYEHTHSILGWVMSMLRKLHLKQRQDYALMRPQYVNRDPQSKAWIFLGSNISVTLIPFQVRSGNRTYP